MRSLTIMPSPELRPYVRLIWLLELEEPTAFGPPERVCPDGLLELVLHYRTPLSCRYEGQSFELQPRSVAVSQTRRFLEFQPLGSAGLVSVRFHPWGAYHFLPLPLCEIADRQVPAESLWPLAVPELEERLAQASEDVERVALVERFLLDQLQRHHKADVEPLVRAVWDCRGRLAMPKLCRDLGVGQRRLQRTFAAALGTTPKSYSNLARFLHACRLLSAGGVRSLTDFGLACGYYDQSHFIEEFRAFSGLTPRQFLRQPSLSFLDAD